MISMARRAWRIRGGIWDSWQSKNARTPEDLSTDLPKVLQTVCRHPNGCYVPYNGTLTYGAHVVTWTYLITPCLEPWDVLAPSCQSK